MSDTYYRERAARRTRLIWTVVGIIVTLACLFFAVNRIFWDVCTQSFTRNPEAVARSYIEAISSGDAEQPRRCWVDQAYFDLETGCSEICISRLVGTPMQVKEIEVSPVEITSAGRAQHSVRITVTCEDQKQEFSGEILLDSIRQNVPWQHWKIISSTAGGPLSAPWCQ